MRAERSSQLPWMMLEIVDSANDHCQPTTLSYIGNSRYKCQGRDNNMYVATLYYFPAGFYLRRFEIGVSIPDYLYRRCVRLDTEWTSPHCFTNRFVPAPANIEVHQVLP